MMERLNALFEANRQPATKERNLADEVQNVEGRNIPQRPADLVERTPPKPEDQGHNQPSVNDFKDRIRREWLMFVPLSLKMMKSIFQAWFARL